MKKIKQPRILNLLVVLLAYLIFLPHTLLGNELENTTSIITIDNLKREYVIHIPSEYDSGTPVPLVIMLHGGGGTAANAMKETGWTDKADKENFIVAFPEGTRRYPRRKARFSTNPQTWNDGSKRENIGAVRKNVNDVAFISALMDDVIKNYSIDKQRIYVTGFSNGASMTFRIGRELSDRIAAIAPVAGCDWLDSPEIKSPLSILYLTGTEDPLNPIEGGEIKIGKADYGNKIPVKDTIHKWVVMLECPEKAEEIYNQNGVTGIAYRPGIKNCEVRFYTVEGMGHAWAGGKNFLPESIIGKTSDKINATDLIWKFFRNHLKE
ncbi:MAG: hypothetical protein JW969_10660 [Spirochaetales bacterium]|nr:hypothetical protein [Spirochaetales bacterium]